MFCKIWKKRKERAEQMAKEFEAESAALIQKRAAFIEKNTAKPHAAMREMYVKLLLENIYEAHTLSFRESDAFYYWEKLLKVESVIEKQKDQQQT